MSEEESYTEYMGKSSVIMFAALVASGLLGLGLRMFLTRSLSVESYGLFFAVFSLVNFLNIAQGLGTLGSMNKFIPEFREKGEYTKLKSSIAIALIVRWVMSILIVGVLFVFSEEIAAEFFGTTSAIPIIRILGIWFLVMTLVSTGKGVFQAFRDIPGNRLADLSQIGFVLLIVVILSWVTDVGIIWVATAYLLSAVFTSVFIMFWMRKHRSLLSKGELSVNKSLAKKLILFGLPLILAGLAAKTTTYVDTLVITTFRTGKEVGLYQVARPATRILLFVGTAVATPLYPMISELWAKRDTDRLRDTLYYLTKLPLLPVIPMVLAFLAFPEEIIRILFGPDYLGATSVLQILSITLLVVAIFNMLGRFIIGIGKNKLYMKLRGLAAVLNFVGDVLLVPILGINGAAIAFLFSFSFSMMLAFYYSRKFIKYPFPIRSLLKILAGSILMLIVLIVLKKIIFLPLWPKLFLVFISGSLFYSLWVGQTGALSQKDIKILKRGLPIPEFLENVMRKFIK